MKAATVYSLKLFALFLFCGNVFCAWYDNAEWYDEYYQYRIPLEVNPSSTGMQVLNMSSDTIVAIINQLEDIHHSAKVSFCTSRRAA